MLTAVLFPWSFTIHIAADGWIPNMNPETIQH